MSRLKITNARRKQRVRLSLRRSGGGRPRLSVFRSSKHIYAQVIDDLKGETLASASSLEKAMRESGNTGANIDAAKAVGKLLAERAVKNGVTEVIRKATESAKRNLTRVALREGRTLHHDIAGRHGAGRVYLRAAPAGTGIIAGGPMRAVFETLGIQDVVAKSIGSSNPYNMVRATFDALQHQDSPRSVAARRNIKVSTLQSRRIGGDAEAAAD